MKATVDGIMYEGTEEEIRRIVENPPRRPPVRVINGSSVGCPRTWGEVPTDPGDYSRTWDGVPVVPCDTATVGRRDDGISCRSRSDHPTGGAE